MANIVFFVIPAHGHTNPTLGLVRALIANGHHVDYYSYDEFKDKIEASGATYHSCNKYDISFNLSPEDGERISTDLVFSTKILVDTTLAFDDILIDEFKSERPDLIIADSMAIWGKAIAYKLNIPFISSTTTFAINNNVSKLMDQNLSDLFTGIKAMFKTKKDIKRLQAKGYPFNNVLDIITNKTDTETIAYTSKFFQPYAQEFGESYSFIGPSIRPVSEEFIKKADKLIYISLGTVVNKQPDFYQKCIDAFKDSDYQVVLSVGDLIDTQSLNNPSSNIEIYHHVDQMAILTKADVFISHCGMNSASESLYFKVPLICVPQTKEQSLVANRVVELKAGLRLKELSVEEIRTLSNMILNDKTYQENAITISDSFKASGGVELAVERIEKYIKQARA